MAAATFSQRDTRARREYTLRGERARAHRYSLFGVRALTSSSQSVRGREAAGRIRSEERSSTTQFCIHLNLFSPETFLGIGRLQWDFIDIA